MKTVSLFLAMLSLSAMACQLTAGGGPGVATATTMLILPTSTTKVVASPVTTSPTTVASSPMPTIASPVPTELAASTIALPTQPATQPPATPTPCSVRLEWPEYITEARDTLFQIAQRAGSTVEQLVIANCLNDGSYIFVGQPLRVPPTMNDPAVGPTRIPDGTELIIFPTDECFSSPFTFDPGVAVGERWRVSTRLEVLTVYDGPHSNNPAGLLRRGEHFWVQEGPACYTKDIAGSQLSFRRWRVQSEERDHGGWIDDRDVFTDFTTIEPRPIVRRFDVFPRVIHSGAPITIAWELEGANEANIYSYHGLHRFASSPVTEDLQLPPTGIITVTAPIPLTSIQYSIGFAPEDPDHWARVTIQCTEHFFADVGDVVSCPTGPVESVEAAYQPFERGFMLWRRDSYSDRIWVMRHNGSSGQVFGDFWAGEDITFAETPPQVLIQPVRGFGKVWVEDEWVRQSLGWATAAEQAYTMELQKTYTSYSSSHFALTLPDGQPISASVGLGTFLTWSYTSRR